jgi:DNA-binding Lrp family transcriptional regulator
MDTLLTTGQLAQRLNASVPRIHRAVKAGVIVPAGRNMRGHLLFDESAERVLRSRWGAIPRIGDLSRSQTQVLAALARRPNGLRSVRAVAREAGISPTAAAHALDALQQRGLVRHRRILVAEGVAREVDNWSVQWLAPEWQRIAPLIHKVELPEPAPRLAKRPQRLPRRVWHLFWDVNPARVDLDRHADYVINRVLEAGDSRAVAWLIQAYPPDALRSVAAKPGRISPEVRRFARALAGGRR